MLHPQVIKAGNGTYFFSVNIQFAGSDIKTGHNIHFIKTDFLKRRKIPDSYFTLLLAEMGLPLVLSAV
jgi:hypothetical protein